MNVKYIVLLFLLIGNRAFSQDYQLRLNDTLIDISVNKNYEVNLNGTLVKLSLSSKDTLEFNNGVFSFKYPKDYLPSKHMIDSTAEQFSIITAEGNGIVVQHYFSINPESLNELMLQEVTKESVEYGYKLSREDYDRTLKSGQVIRVIKAVLTYKDDVNIYEIASIGRKDDGLVILTVDLTKKSEQGKKIINLLWNSLKY